MLKFWLFVLFFISSRSWAAGTVNDDIGYSRLQTELGAATPNGAGVNVLQIEASQVASTDPSYPVYAPDTTGSQFSGISFNFPGTASTAVSGHATTVADIFFSNASMAAGVNKVGVYEVNGWLNAINFNAAPTPLNGSRIANDSWVGEDTTNDAAILRLTDRMTYQKQLIQVVGMNNGATPQALLSSAYNVISVGLSSGAQAKGSVAVDSVYVGGRTKPDLVAPQSVTSYATAYVSSAAAVLVQAGHQAGLGLSTGSTTVSGIGTVYDAERAETVKAALMAGADRVTANTSTTDNITAYGSGGNATANGLDSRYGAGQLDVYNSYHIINGGEHHSQQDGNSSYISQYGFDYDTAFGGANGSNSSATYSFIPNTAQQFSASLVWELGVSNNAALSTTLHHLTLALYDVSTASYAAQSLSTLDNTQNIYTQLTAGDIYQLQVTAADGVPFKWQYGLAWQMQPTAVPLPGTALLFGAGLMGLLGWRRRV